MRTFGRAALLLAALSALWGCAAHQRVVDGTVVNGIPGKATATPKSVQNLSPGELLVLYPSTEGIERPGEPARVDFVHYELVGQQKDKSGGGGGSSAGGLGDALKQPHFMVNKTVALDDDSPSTAIEVNVDRERLRGRSDATISYYFTVVNTGEGAASTATIVDWLPDEYTVAGVDIYDNGGHAAWKYIPPILPAGWILLAPLTFPSAQSRTKFDSIKWDLKQVDGHNVIVIQFTTTKPLEQGDFVMLRVMGHMAFPVPR
jgi:hypothetical protein